MAQAVKAQFMCLHAHAFAYQDAFGITAMFEAVRMGNAEVVEVLQSYDAK